MFGQTISNLLINTQQGNVTQDSLAQPGSYRQQIQQQKERLTICNSNIYFNKLFIDEVQSLITFTQKSVCHHLSHISPNFKHKNEG